MAISTTLPITNNQNNTTTPTATGTTSTQGNNSSGNTGTLTGNGSTGTDNFTLTSLGNTGGTSTTPTGSSVLSQLASILTGQTNQGLSLNSQPVQSLFQTADGLDGNNINSNQTVLSSVLSLLQQYLNPQADSQVNTAQQDGTLQDLMDGNNTNTTTTANNGTTDSAAANNTTAANTAPPTQAATTNYKPTGTYNNQTKSLCLSQQDLDFIRQNPNQAQAVIGQVMANSLCGPNANISDPDTQRTICNAVTGSDIDSESDNDMQSQVASAYSQVCSSYVQPAIAQSQEAPAPSDQAPAAITASQPAQQAAQTTTQTVQQDDPLVFDLSGNGLGTSNQKVVANIDGKNQLVNNITSGEGVMTLGGQILGDKTNLSKFGITQQPTSAENALQLIAQQAYQKGLISSPTNLTASDLQVLQKDYGLAIRSGNLNGQDESFAQAGISGINVSDNANTSTNLGNGNTLTQNGTSFTRSNGSQGGVGDIWYQV